jgi:hypothetical protein
LPGWGEALAILVAYFLYEWARARVSGSPADAARNARQVVAAERALGIFHEATVQGWFLGRQTFLRAWDVYYGTVHFVGPVVVLAWLWRRRPKRYRRWRNTLVATGLVALVAFALYPVLPPRLLPSHFGFVDIAARYGGLGPLGQPPAKVMDNPYAAMPSLHVGWATWCACVLVSALRRRWIKVLAVAYPFVTLFAVVVTANHYVLDGVGGVAAVALGWAAATALSRRSRPACRPPRGGSPRTPPPSPPARPAPTGTAPVRPAPPVPRPPPA